MLRLWELQDLLPHHRSKALPGCKGIEFDRKKCVSQCRDSPLGSILHGGIPLHEWGSDAHLP